MALITKVRRDGVTKHRIIVDMRRSGANARARIPERPVLPRPCDAVQDAIEVFKDRTPRLKPSPTASDSCDSGDDSWGVEQVTGDFGDAYMHCRVTEQEHKHCLVKKPRDLRIDTYLPEKLRNKEAGSRWADFALLVML